MDLSSLIAAVDFTAVSAAILAVAALKVAPSAVIWAATKVLAMVRR